MQSVSLNALWVWHICKLQCFGNRYQLFPWIKCWASWNRTDWCKTIMKFCLHKFHISRLLQWTTPREGLGTAKLFVGVVGNDVTVNNKGGATYNNNKQSLKASCYKIDSNFAAIIQPQKSLTQSLMPLSSAKQFVKRTHSQSLCKCTSCKEKQFSRALLAILSIATWCRPSVVDGGDRNSAISKWWNWVGMADLHDSITWLLPRPSGGQLVLILHTKCMGNDYRGR